MNATSKRKPVFLSMTIVAFAISQVAVSQEKSWRGSASGQTAPLIESSGHYDEFGGWGGGQVGHFLAIGYHSMHSDLSLSGEATWVGPHGDRLYVQYEGNVIITKDRHRPYRFKAMMQVQGGTGRFQGSHGHAIMNGSFNSTLDRFRFEFEGELETSTSMQSAGTIQLSTLRCGLGEPASYVMHADKQDATLPFQTGTMTLASDPVVDDSNPDTTVFIFQVKTGTNQNTGRPLHIVHTPRGNLFCEFDGQVRLEIDHTHEGLATKCFDGFYTIIGGTGDYRRAEGAWRLSFTTDPAFGGPVTASYSIEGNLNLNQGDRDPRDLMSEDRIDLPTGPAAVDAETNQYFPTPERDSAAWQLDAMTLAAKSADEHQLTADEVSRQSANIRILPPLPRPRPDRYSDRNRSRIRSTSSEGSTFRPRSFSATTMTIGAPGKSQP